MVIHVRLLVSLEFADSASNPRFLLRDSGYVELHGEKDAQGRPTRELLRASVDQHMCRG